MDVDTGKLIKSPEVTFDYDKKTESLVITVELPGVKENSYELNLATCGFRISANTKDMQYKGVYRFYHEVDADEVKTKFKNGTLTIIVPFFAPICGRQMPLDVDVVED